MKRLAKYLGIGAEETGRRFTTIFEDDEVRETVLRHQKDEAYGSVCRFLDLETRACTVHPARPQICRGHPGELDIRGSDRPASQSVERRSDAAAPVLPADEERHGAIVGLGIDDDV